VYKNQGKDREGKRDAAGVGSGKEQWRIEDALYI
jgi:hypothetical protein